MAVLVPPFRFACGPRRCWPLLCYPVLILSMLEEPRLIVVVLYQDRTAINHNGLPGAESFLHQEQIGLRDLGSFADSANWETVAHALIETFPLRYTHGLPEVRANDTGRYCVNPYWCQLDR